MTGAPPKRIRRRGFVYAEAIRLVRPELAAKLIVEDPEPTLFAELEGEKPKGGGDRRDSAIAGSRRLAGVSDVAGPGGAG